MLALGQVHYTEEQIQILLDEFVEAEEEVCYFGVLGCTLYCNFMLITLILINIYMKYIECVGFTCPYVLLYVILLSQPLSYFQGLVLFSWKRMFFLFNLHK